MRHSATKSPCLLCQSHGHLRRYLPVYRRRLCSLFCSVFSPALAVLLLFSPADSINLPHKAEISHILVELLLELFVREILVRVDHFSRFLDLSIGWISEDLEGVCIAFHEHLEKRLINHLGVLAKDLPCDLYWVYNSTGDKRTMVVTLVFIKQPDQWLITALQNTFKSGRQL